MNIFLNSLEDVEEEEDVTVVNNPHYTSWELLLAATSFQACLISGNSKNRMSTATKSSNWQNEIR